MTLGVSQEALINYLRAKIWVDMRVVDIGTLQRVRLQTIRLHMPPAIDAVEIEQLYTPPDEGSKQLLRHGIHSFHIDDVMWIRPSTVRLIDVVPYLIPEKERTEEDDGSVGESDAPPMPSSHLSTEAYQKRIVSEILNRVAKHYGGSVTELFASSNDGATSSAKTIAMLLLYEMTELPESEICARVGFAPMHGRPLEQARSESGLSYIYIPARTIAQEVETRLENGPRRSIGKSKFVLPDPMTFTSIP